MTDNLNYKPTDDSNNDKNFIGKGSYGCTYFPGIDCSGKKNRKKYLTKIEEINFYSTNEIKISKIIRKIPKYSSNFAPILKYCYATFDKLQNSPLEIDKCETLFDELTLFKKLQQESSLFKNNKYYLFSIKFIENYSFKKFFIKINDHIDLFNNFYIIYLNLLNSIYLLNKHNIIHNDLHYENIIIDNKNNKPIIIDFGLSYNADKMFNRNDIIKSNLNYLKRFFMDFREDSYNHNIEKRFISFISYNKTPNHNINLNSNFENNNLTKNNVDFFIHDAMQSIMMNKEISGFYTDKEFNYYKTSLEKFYYKYLNKEKYKYYSDIINELLPLVFEFEDLYKLSINYLIIYYFKQDFINSNDSLKLILNLFIQIIKKVLHPDPAMRLKLREINLIIKFVIKTINNQDINLDYKNFNTKFNEFIKKNNLPVNIIFQKDFAFIDFNSIFNNNTIDFIKKSNIKV